MDLFGGPSKQSKTAGRSGTGNRAMVWWLQTGQNSVKQFTFTSDGGYLAKDIQDFDVVALDTRLSEEARRRLRSRKPKTPSVEEWMFSGHIVNGKYRADLKEFTEFELAWELRAIGSSVASFFGGLQELMSTGEKCAILGQFLDDFMSAISLSHQLRYDNVVVNGKTWVLPIFIVKDDNYRVDFECAPFGQFLYSLNPSAEEYSIVREFEQEGYLEPGNTYVVYFRVPRYSNGDKWTPLGDDDYYTPGDSDYQD